MSSVSTFELDGPTLFTGGGDPAMGTHEFPSPRWSGAVVPVTVLTTFVAAGVADEEFRPPVM